MLERVPATAESAAQCLLRNVDRPYRSSRLLDTNFWRHGTQQSDTPAWWPIYLNKVRAVPHSRPYTVTDAPSQSVAAVKTRTSPWAPEGGRKVMYSIHDVGAHRARRYTQASRRAQAYASQEVEVDYDDLLYKDGMHSPPHGNYHHDTTYVSSQNDHDQTSLSHLDPFLRAHQGENLFPLPSTGAFTDFADFTADLTQYSGISTRPTYSVGDEYEPVEAPPTPEGLRDIVELPQPRPPKDIRATRKKGKRRVAASEDTVNRTGPTQSEVLEEEDETKRLSVQKDRSSVANEDLVPDTVYQEAWEIYIHSKDRAEHAARTFEVLSQSSTPKQKVRAITALRELSRQLQTQKMRSWTQAPRAKDYREALDLELRDHQHDSAIDVASQAAYSKVNLFPKLAAEFIRATLWTPLGNLLARCHQDKRIEALVSSMHGYPAEQKGRLPEGWPTLTTGLLIECIDAQTLPASISSMTRALAVATTISERNIEDLRSVRSHLKQLCVRSEKIMKRVSLEDFYSMIDNRTDSESLHIRGLRTIINAPYTAGIARVALRIHHSLRQRHHAYLIRPNVLDQLMRLCVQDHMPVKTLLELFEDSRLSHHQNTKGMYNSIMSACAKQGAVETLKQLSDMYQRDHGRPDDLRILSPLIYVHAVSGDAQNAQREFDRIKYEFKMTPNIVCWNMLLLAHARSEDSASAFQIRGKMSDAHISPDSYTYGTLLSVCAERGDANAAVELMREVIQSGVPVTPVMSNTVVEAYLANNDIQRARQWVFETSNSMQRAGSKESRTRLWNSLLRYYAFNADATNFDIVEKSMRRRNVKLDEMSYAASLALLVNTSRIDQALEELRRFVKTGDVAVTQLHYAIVLAGLIKSKRRDMTTTLLHDMEQHFPHIDQKVGELILRQQAERAVGRTKEKSTDYSTAVELLIKLLSEQEGSQHAASQAFLKSLLQSMMSHGSSEQAGVLLGAIEAQQSSSNSLGLLVQSLKINMENKNWTVVNDIWQKLFTTTRQRNLSLRPDKKQSTPEETSSSPASVTSSKTDTGATPVSDSGPQVLADRRFALEEPLNYYMEAMARQSKQSELLRLLRDDFRTSGFALTGRNWNKLIQLLCRSHNPSHHVKAFEFSEEYMINRAQSWKLLMRGKLRREVFQPLTEASKAGEKAPPQYKIVDRLEAIATDRQRRIPTYLTMVHLASVLDRTQKRAAASTDRRQLDKIIAAGPKTKRFLQQMPYSNDNLQRTILRGEPPYEETKSRPRSEESVRRNASLASRFGERSVLDQLSPEHLLEAQSMFQEFGTQPDYEEDTRIQHAERWTGQVSTEPIVLAGAGRLERRPETEARVRSQRKQKLGFFNAVMRELRLQTVHVQRDGLRGGSTEPAYRPKLTPASKSGSSPSSIAQPSRLVTSVEATLQKIQQLAATKADTTRPPLTVHERLERLATEKSLRNEQLKARQLLGSTATKLAIPYAQLRRKRRNIAFKQRTAAAAALRVAYKRYRPETDNRTFTRSKRFRQFVTARGRIRALRIRRKEAELRGQGMDVNPNMKVQSPDVGAGELKKFRFVTPQRRSKRSQAHISHRTRTLLSIRKRMRRGQVFNNPKIPYTGAAFRYNMYRHRMRLLQRYYERRLETLPEDFEHKLRSEIYRKLQRVKLHLLRFGVARPDGSIDTEPWQKYLAAVKANEYGDPTFWTAQRLAEIEQQESPAATPAQPQGPDAFTPLMYGKTEAEERQDLLAAAERQARKREIDEIVAEQAQYELDHKDEYEQLRAEKEAREAEKRGEGIYVPFAGGVEASDNIAHAQGFLDDVGDDIRDAERGYGGESEERDHEYSDTTYTSRQ